MGTRGCGMGTRGGAGGGCGRGAHKLLPRRDVFRTVACILNNIWAPPDCKYDYMRCMGPAQLNKLRRVLDTRTSLIRACPCTLPTTPAWLADAPAPIPLQLPPAPTLPCPPGPRAPLPHHGPQARHRVHPVRQGHLRRRVIPVEREQGVPHAHLEGGANMQAADKGAAGSRGREHGMPHARVVVVPQAASGQRGMVERGGMVERARRTARSPIGRHRAHAGGKG